MNKAILFFGLSAVVALTGAVAACSSTTTTSGDTTGTEAGAKEGGPSDGGGGQDTSMPPDDSGTTPDPDLACKAEATFTKCGICCATNHTAGYKVFQDSLLGCGCKGTGADGGAPCATDCATTLCKSPPASGDATCNACLQTSVGASGACQDKVSTDCTASPDCVLQQKCIVTCKGKPM